MLVCVDLQSNRSEYGDLQSPTPRLTKCRIPNPNAFFLLFLHTMKNGVFGAELRHVWQRRTGYRPTLHVALANAPRCVGISPVLRPWTSQAKKCAKTRKNCSFYKVQMPIVNHVLRVANCNKLVFSTDLIQPHFAEKMTKTSSEGILSDSRRFAKNASVSKNPRFVTFCQHIVIFFPAAL